MSDILDYAIELVKRAQSSWAHFIVDNETGSTGGHQSGFYIPKGASGIAFDSKFSKGQNHDKYVKINWYGYKETDSRFIYYGIGSRNEYRLTRFGQGFPFLTKEMSGNLLVLARISNDYYEAAVLQSDDEIDTFMATLNISPLELNNLISEESHTSTEDNLKNLISEYIEDINSFPTTTVMSDVAQKLYMKSHCVTVNRIIKDYDKHITKLIETEFLLFKAIEQKLFLPEIQSSISKKTVDEFVQYANSIVNRRKSRAGKSLENHLAGLFKIAGLKFEEQVVTENKSKPDFIFPGHEEYHNFEFPAEDLVCLGAKTTCKDRWRQVIEEADRVETKHLFTLQKGISKNQLVEMYDRRICLVVPQSYKDSYVSEFRPKILSLKEFIGFVGQKQNI